jgi:hypothetical protein
MINCLFVTDASRGISANGEVLARALDFSELNQTLGQANVFSVRWLSIERYALPDR